ncbi:MAG: hypothetical protein WEA76_00570 [Acidimicrobiia bacterium]
MDLVDVSIGEADYRAVKVPTSFVDRWRGMKVRTGAMVFSTSSVHGFGMDRDLTVVAIDAAGIVIAVKTLRPRWIVAVPRARHILELEIGLPRPRVGDPVRFYDRVHGGTTGGVRDSDRQPGRHLSASRRDAEKR